MSAAPIPQGDAEMLRQFFAGERNRVGDYWHPDTARAAFDRQSAALAASEARVAELEKELSAHSWPMTCASLLATHVLGHFALPTESSQVICKDWAAKTKAAIDALLPKGEGATS